MPALPEPHGPAEQRQSSSEQRLVVYNVAWDHYEQLCELFAGHNVRLAYQQGTLSRIGHVAQMRRFRDWVRKQRESEAESAG
jgi:hypothetical protein